MSEAKTAKPWEAWKQHRSIIRAQEKGVKTTPITAKYFNRVWYVLVQLRYPTDYNEYILFKIAENGFILKAIKLEEEVIEHLCRSLPPS